METPTSERSMKHVQKLRTNKEKYDALVRWVMLVEPFRRGSTVQKRIEWIQREPLPDSLRIRAETSEPGLVTMRAIWATVKSEAPGGMLRDDLKWLRLVAEAEYELRRLGNDIPSGPDPDPKPVDWQRSRNEWTKQRTAAYRELSSIDIAPLDALVPNAALPRGSGANRADRTGNGTPLHVPLASQELDDLVG